MAEQVLAQPYTVMQSAVSDIADLPVAIGFPDSHEPGTDGLVHISKLGGSQRIEKVEDVVKVCQLIAPTYGGINLEDIAAIRAVPGLGS